MKSWKRSLSAREIASHETPRTAEAVENTGGKKWTSDSPSNWKAEMKDEIAILLV